MSSRGLSRILNLFQPRSHRSNPLLLPMPRREHHNLRASAPVRQTAWCRQTVGVRGRRPSCHSTKHYRAYDLDRPKGKKRFETSALVPAESVAEVPSYY